MNHKEILNAILDAKQEYRLRYQKAMRIAQQFFMYGANELLPSTPSGFALHHDVIRYTYKPEFASLGEAVSEQILMDQLAISIDPNNPSSKSLEEPPDRLTVSRLSDLFSHCLYQNVIDLNWLNEKQIAILLNSQAPYVALVRNGKYESILKHEDGERLIIRELFVQFPK